MNKTKSITLKSISLWLILFFCFTTNAQYNLVPNSSFEDNVICNNLSTVPIPWYLPTSYLFQGGSYANSCAINSSANVPYNGAGFQFALNGQGYGFIKSIDYSFINSNRLYLQIKLKDSLINKHKYYVEFYVSVANYGKYGSNNVSLLFSKTAKYVDTLVDPKGVINESPQIVNYGNPIITDTMDWVKVSGIYVAKGGEQYITIGNFKDDNQTKSQVSNSAGIGFAAGYYIDDVSVIPLDSMCLKADAGKDITIQQGDSAFIGGYTNGIDSLLWLENGITKRDSIRPGFYVYPTSTTFYVLHQIVNGCFSSDTVFVNVLLPLKFISYNLVSSLRGTKQSIENIWQTASEINVSHFNIQRSINGKDFTIIGKIKAQNKITNEYNFIDNELPITNDQLTIYYRIESVDFNGRKQYSTTQQINTKHQTPNIVLFPNPATTTVNIASQQNIKEIKIINQLGQVVKHQTPNTKQITLNTEQFAKGVYMVQITTSNGEIKTQKIIFQ